MHAKVVLLGWVGDPSGLLLVWAGLGVVVLVAAMICLRHHRTKRRVTRRFEEFKEHVILLRQRVEAIKERQQLLLQNNQDYREAMRGETLALYQRIQADVSRLWDDWLQRMDIWDQVQVLIRSERFPGVRRLLEASRLLDQLGAFTQIDQACEACVMHLDRLEQGHQQAQRMLGQAEERAGQFGPQFESLGRLPLPTAPYEAELAACAEATEQARELLRADPIGAQTILQQTWQRLAELQTRLQEITRLFQQAQQARSTVDEIVAVAARHRAQGLLLVEPEGNPDPLLEHARTQHAALLQALEGGAVQPATEGLEQTLLLTEQARQAIERQVAARDRCWRDLPARRVAAEELQPLRAAAHEQRQQLEQNFAPESWQAVAGHVTQADELQRTAAAWLDEAARAADATVQHYFRAGDLLDRVQRHQEQAHSDLTAIGQCLETLTALRRECLQRREELVALAHRVQDFFAAQRQDHRPAAFARLAAAEDPWVREFCATHRDPVRPPARSLWDAAEAQWRATAGQFEAPRPNWPRVQEQLQQARQRFTAALQAAEEDVRAHQQLTARLTDVGREADRVGHFLQQHQEDRPQANALHRSAIETLQRLCRHDAVQAADWKQLLQQLEEASAAVKRAEELARQDLRLAERANLEIAAAENELGRAREFCALGLAANLAAAEGQLRQAQHQLAAQAYEQAIAAATAAQQNARQALADVQQRARQEQLRQDQERQRREAAARPSEPAWQPGQVEAPLPAEPGSSEPGTSPPRRESEPGVWV